MIFDIGSYYCKTIRAWYLIQISIIVQNKDMILIQVSIIVQNKDMILIQVSFIEHDKDKIWRAVAQW